MCIAYEVLPDRRKLLIFTVYCMEKDTEILSEKATVSVFTLGCKVNLYESRQIVGQLLAAGYDAFEGLKKADYFVINTCAVTNEAERKSRQAISRCLRLNPAAKIIVCGCASQKDSKQFFCNGVVFVKGAGNKAELVQKYIDGFDGVEKLPTHYGEGEIFASNAVKTRAFLKIQDGCNRFCTYCIIPYLRGRSRSRSVSDIVAEARSLTDVKEVVLTGVDISDYNTQEGDLTALAENLAFLPMRKRFGSLEVHVITQRLLDAMKKSNFCPHFHLSLQSGSNDVLKKMNRHYTAEEFLSAINLIRQNFPDAGITTDVIVGFPTESEQNFEETCDFVQKVGFDDIHVFPFSPRSGTVASKMTPVSGEAVHRRVQKLSKIKQLLVEQSANRQIGTVQQVLTEESKGDYIVGYTANYTKVYLPKKSAGKNKIIKVYISKQFDDGVFGSIIEE